MPLRGASHDGEDVRVTVDKQAVKDAPGVDADQELSEAEERQLFEHYGVPYTTEGSTTAQGVAGEAITRPRRRRCGGRGRTRRLRPHHR